MVLQSSSQEYPRSLATTCSVRVQGINGTSIRIIFYGLSKVVGNINSQKLRQFANILHEPKMRPIDNIEMGDEF